MTIVPGTIDHLAQIISQVVAPSFVLGAVAGFLSMVHARLTGVIDRIRYLNAIPATDPDRAFLKEDIQRQRRRARYLAKSIFFGIAAGITTTLLIIIAFGMAFLSLPHVWATAFMFILSLALFCVALVMLVMDSFISVDDYDHF
ncbi:DUF2721 domain-containing protein [Neotabrizicola shimadae]|uniref:DUF2721 domain-containing protein n=1 Tax=Neotabrizicola shimadae TaxID=2807096 RepID=A0A8G1EBQ9_9RHOB|nr:DUF2721 domain-containing protein [Neotabrizicola shimadae]QYZ68308.1 DUF2721 domain-containing protein [Neotabrizicola shimadae]